MHKNITNMYVCHNYCGLHDVQYLRDIDIYM